MEGKPVQANKSKSSCCVPHCTLTGYVLAGDGKVTFHSLPKNDAMLKTWLVKIRRDTGPNFTVSKYTRICSQHFTPADFTITEKGRRFLRPAAIPSRFPWSKDKPDRCKRQRALADATGTDDQPDNAEQTEVEMLKAKIAALERDKEQEREAADLFKRERDHLKDIIRKQGRVTRKHFCLADIIHSNDLIYFHTGFPTYKAMIGCLKYLNPGDNAENIKIL